MGSSFDDVLEQLRRLRRTMLSDLHELESGLRRHSEKQAGEWVDITPQLIKGWRDESEQLERLIAMYEERFKSASSDLGTRRKA